MRQLVHPVHLRWLGDDERSAFQEEDLNFLLHVPHDLRFWFRSRPLSDTELSELPHLAHLYDEGHQLPATLRHADLHLLTPGALTPLPLARHLRFGRPDPLLRAPGGTVAVEHLRHISGSQGDVTFLVATSWPPQLSIDLLAPLFTAPGRFDLLFDFSPMAVTDATRLLRHRLRALGPHVHRDPVYKRPAEDAAALLDQLVGRTNRLFRVAVAAAFPGLPTSRELRMFRQLAHSLGFAFAPIPFQQAGVHRLFSERFGVEPPLLRMLDAQTLTHLGLYEWAAPAADQERHLFLGIDSDHQCLVMHQRWQTNPSAFVLGLPGSGKSTFSKVELLRRLEASDARAIVFDPEGEYELLVRHLQGISIPIGASGTQLNPLAAPGRGDVEGKLLRIPALLAGNLGPAEVLRLRLLLAECYRHSTAPTFRDLLGRIPADDPLFPVVWPYADGPLRGFSAPLRRFPDHRLIAFNLSQADSETVSAAVPLLIELVGDWVRSHRQQGYPLSVTLDEVHLFLRHGQVRSSLLSLLKRARKVGVSFTGVTQNVGDFLLSDDGGLLLANAGLLVLFRQSPDDLRMLRQRYRLSARPSQWLSLAEPGEALLVDSGVRPVTISLSALESSIANTTPVSLR